MAKKRDDAPELPALQAAHEAERLAELDRLAERYPQDEAAWLVSKGWIDVPLAERPSRDRRWRDPLSGKASATEVVACEKRLRNGRIERILQRVEPSALWHYSTAEAVAVQLDRDERARAKES